MEYILLFLDNFIDMFVDVAPYIILGLIFVALLNAYVKKELILRHLGGQTLGSVVKASVVGVPLPLCSCGVVPTAIGLKKSGASNGAVTSFLISTPQTGVDSILATYSLMGIVMAVFRPIAAFISGILGGLVVDLVAKKETGNPDVQVHSCCDSTTSSCCGEVKKEEHPHESCGCGCEEHTHTHPHTSCGCGGEEHTHTHPHESCGCGCEEEPHTHVHTSCGCGGGCEQEHTGGSKLVFALKNAFSGFLDEIVLHFLIGMLLSSLISTFVPADFFVNFGLDSGLLAMVAMVIIGIPMYICSVGAIPIAISLVAKGVSYGAAFVFLFAGPVTNIASILVLSKALGKKVTAIYLGVTTLCAIGFGLLLDFIIAAFDLHILGVMGGVSHGNEMISTVLAIFLAALMIKSLIKLKIKN